MPGTKVSGSIPSEIGQLTKLGELKFSRGLFLLYRPLKNHTHNCLAAPLMLHCNQAKVVWGGELTGTLPSEIGQWTELGTKKVVVVYTLSYPVDLVFLAVSHLMHLFAGFNSNCSDYGSNLFARNARKCPVYHWQTFSYLLPGNCEHLNRRAYSL